MGYEEIDGIIGKWVEKNGLALAASDRGEEIRCIARERFDKNGTLTEGISVLIGPFYEGKIGIWANHYAIIDKNSRKKYPRMGTLHKKEFEVEKHELFAVLEEAYELANSWM
ncbi:MAG: hypothetical protein KDB79_08895 [Acidobacteria bacterium]|nr:hypothetical protein [Acidobacteriota bacterium]